MVRSRWPAVAAVALILGLAFGIRALSGGGLEQHSGTALYASMILLVIRRAAGSAATAGRGSRVGLPPA